MPFRRHDARDRGQPLRIRCRVRKLKRHRLTPRGRKQAEITGAYLRERYGDFDARYVSYYWRAQETMSIMCPNETAHEDPRLAEVQRGIWHTMAKKKVRDRFPDEAARQEKEGLYHYRPWGGENCPDVELRIDSFLGMLGRDCDGQKAVIVVHGHWLILFQRIIEHFSVKETEGRFRRNEIKNASVMTYENFRIEEKSQLPQTDYVVPWEGRL